MPSAARAAAGRRSALYCSAALGLALAAMPAAAQETGQGTFLGRILFSFGTPRVAIDTPQSVTVVESADFERFQPVTVADALAGVPGINMAGANTSLGQAFNIRGVGMTEEPSAERRIVVTVDGAPKFFEQYRMGSFFTDPELYERVEVLRGPASSTLYGAGALGGVVNFTTRDAADFLDGDDTFALRTRLGTQSNGDGLMGSVIAAQGFGNFETLTALSWRTSDAYENGDGNPVLGTDSGSLSGLVKGTWYLPGEQVLRLSYEQFDSQLDDTTVVPTGGAAVVPVFGTIDRHVTDQTVILSWENPVPENDWLDLSAQVSWSNTQTAQWGHTPASPFVVCAPGRTAILCEAEYGYETLAARVQNTATMSGAGWENVLTFGIEASHQDRTAASEYGALDFHPEGTDTRLSLYAQSELTIGERLTIIPGLRADWNERSPAETVPAAETVADLATSPKIAAIYAVSDAFSVFGSVALTERLPTIDELYSYSATQTASTDLEKESSFNTELGFALDLVDVIGAGDSLQLKATLFRNEVENLIQRTATTQPTYFENVANAIFEGYELEAGYESDLVFASLAYAQVDARDTTWGYTLTSNPQDLLTTTLGLRLDAQGLELGWRGHFAADITTESRSTATGLITATDHDGYATHDLFVNWTPAFAGFEDTTLSLSVSNVTDDVWRSNLMTDDGAGRSVDFMITRTF